MTGTNINVSVVFIGVGGDSTELPLPSDTDTETTVDVSMIISMAPRLDTVYVYCSSDDNVAAVQQMAIDNFVSSASTSWSGDFNSAALNSALQQMAAQGQTFFSASGDTGCDEDWTPNEQPFLTSVGGTLMGSNWQQGGVSKDSFPGEVSWAPQSGGGFAYGSPIPSWQVAAAAANPQASTQWRNIPDVSAFAGSRYQPQFVIYIEGSGQALSGTSIAAPLWAGFMALVNQNQTRNGQPHVGFINPLLYEIYNSTYYDFAFRDMNDMSTNADGTCTVGNTAVDGYDLVTGLGTFNGTNLMNALAMLTAGCNSTLSAPALTSAMMPLQTNFYETQSQTFWSRLSKWQ